MTPLPQIYTEEIVALAVGLYHVSAQVELVCVNSVVGRTLYCTYVAVALKHPRGYLESPELSQ